MTMTRAKDDCKLCNGTGELYVATRADYRGEPEEVFTVCPCVQRITVEV